MAATKDPRPYGSYHVNVNDGTNALIAAPRPASAGDHSPAKPHRIVQNRNNVHLTFAILPNQSAHAHKSGSREGQVWQVSREPYVAWLYDFPVKGAQLGSAHKRFLDQLASDLAGRQVGAVTRS